MEIKSSQLTNIEDVMIRHPMGLHSSGDNDGFDNGVTQATEYEYDANSLFQT